MSANISVHIVHTKPSPEPVKPCLLCVRGQGKFKIPDSFKIIDEILGVDLSLLANVPKVDQLFCMDCKMKLEQVKSFRAQVKQMYTHMCAIFLTKSKLKNALAKTAPEASLSFSLPSAVLSLSSDMEDTTNDIMSENSQMPNFLVTLNIHLDEGSTKTSEVMDTINSHLNVMTLKTSRLDNLLDVSSDLSEVEKGEEAIFEASPSEDEPPPPTKKSNPKMPDDKKASPKTTIESPATPRMRTRGIKLDFTTTFKRRQEKTIPLKEESNIIKKGKIHKGQTGKRLGRPPKKIASVENETLKSGIDNTQKPDSPKDDTEGMNPGNAKLRNQKSRGEKQLEAKSGEVASSVEQEGLSLKRKAEEMDEDDESEDESETNDRTDGESEVEKSIPTSKKKIANIPVTGKRRGRRPINNVESFITELGWKNDDSDFEIIAKLTEKYGKNYHMLEEPYECGHCAELFAELEPLQAHVDSKHNDKADGNANPAATEEAVLPFKCSICSVSFATADVLSEHTSYHGNKSNASVDSLKDPREPNTCGICGRTMMNLKEVAKHILNVHQDSKNFECDVCHKKFGCHWYLREHKVSHDTTYSYICEYCGCPYKRQYDYKMHLLTHTGKGFLCNICSMECRTQYDLKLHKYNAHKTFKEFQCLICYKTLKENKHILKHTCFKPSKDKLIEKIDKSGRPFYVCKFCSESFNKKSQLAVHMLKEGHLPLQAGERASKWRLASLAKGIDNQYTCPQCQMTFLTAKETRYHIMNQDCTSGTRKVMEDELKKILLNEHVSLLKEVTLVRCQEAIMGQSVFCKCQRCQCLIANLPLYKTHITECTGPQQCDNASQDNGDELQTNPPPPPLYLDKDITITGDQLPAYEAVVLGPRAERFVKRCSKRTYVKTATYGQNQAQHHQHEVLIACGDNAAIDENASVKCESALPMTTYLCAVCNSMFVTLEDVHHHMKVEHETEVESLASSEAQTLVTTEALVVEGLDQNVDLTFNTTDGVVYTTAVSSEMFPESVTTTSE